jgi:hypothetical protein
MAEPQFSTAQDDDLPRTLRRERDARQQRQAQAQGPQPTYVATGSHALDQPPGDGVTVTAFEVPFFRLMAFLMKVVLAAIPALVLLGLILFAIGQVAQTYLPWLVKMQIVVNFPK